MSITLLSNLTQDYLKSILYYDPKSGLWYWLVNKGLVNLGDVAGHIQGKKDYRYVSITINGIGYLAHRLAHLYMTGEWPENHLDHENSNGLDNSWNNIRKATRSQNLGNQKTHINNTSGFKGVTWDKKAGKWSARIQVDGKSKFLGYFAKEDIDKASDAYEKAAEELFKEFARFG